MMRTASEQAAYLDGMLHGALTMRIKTQGEFAGDAGRAYEHVQGVVRTIGGVAPALNVVLGDLHDDAWRGGYDDCLALVRELAAQVGVVGLAADVLGLASLLEKARDETLERRKEMVPS